MQLYKRLIIRLVIFFYIVSNTSLHAIKRNLPSTGIQPLNIIFIVDHFPARSQTFILNIITGLIDSGHNVSIFSFHKDKVVNPHPDIAKYNLLKCVIYEQFSAQLPPCDIVFCQFGYLGKRLFKIKELEGWLKSKKVVVCFRGSDLSAYIKNDPLMYKKLLRKVNLFLPVCDYFKKRLITLGCHPDKIIVHHSAIDCSHFFFKKRKMPEAGPIHLVSVCRLIEKKGMGIAIAAIAKVMRKYKSIHFTIVGDGPERAYLEKLIQKLKLTDAVTMQGWGTRDQVVDILDRSHIFLLPSLTSSNGDEEGIANALKESMAMGLISVGTWHAGTPELIDHNVSGFLVPEGDSIQLAKTIEYIIEHPEIWEAVGVAARQKIIKEFEIQKSIKELEKIFCRLVGCNPPTLLLC